MAPSATSSLASVVMIAKVRTHSPDVGSFQFSQGPPNDQRQMRDRQRDEVPVVLALRLFLPESWTRERTRLERAGVLPIRSRRD